MGGDEERAVLLQNVARCAARPHRLPLEHELRDVGDEVLDAPAIRPEVTGLDVLNRSHGLSLYRRDQQLVKHAKTFSELAQNLLG